MLSQGTFRNHDPTTAHLIMSSKSAHNLAIPSSSSHLSLLGTSPTSPMSLRERRKPSSPALTIATSSAAAVECNEDTGDDTWSPEQLLQLFDGAAALRALFSSSSAPSSSSLAMKSVSVTDAEMQLEQRIRGSVAPV